MEFDKLINLNTNVLDFARNGSNCVVIKNELINFCKNGGK